MANKKKIAITIGAGLNMFCQAFASAFLLNTLVDYYKDVDPEESASFDPRFLILMMVAGWGAVVSGLSSYFHSEPTHASTLGKTGAQAGALDPLPVKSNFIEKHGDTIHAVWMGLVFSVLNMFEVEDESERLIGGSVSQPYRSILTWGMGLVLAGLGEGIYAMYTHHSHNTNEETPSIMWKKLKNGTQSVAAAPNKAYLFLGMLICLCISELSEAALTVDLTRRALDKTKLNNGIKLGLIFGLASPFALYLSYVQLVTASSAILRYMTKATGSPSDPGRLGPDGKPAPAILKKSYLVTTTGCINDVLGGAAGMINVIQLLGNRFKLEQAGSRLAVIISAVIVSQFTGVAQVLTDIAGTNDYVVVPAGEWLESKGSAAKNWLGAHGCWWSRPGSADSEEKRAVLDGGHSNSDGMAAGPSPV